MSRVVQVGRAQMIYGCVQSRSREQVRVVRDSKGREKWKEMGEQSYSFILLDYVWHGSH